MFINAICYFITCLSAMLFHKQELQVTFVHMLVFLVLVYLHLYRVYSIYTSILTGIVLSIVSFICVRYFKMWKHSLSHYDIPLWMPFTWCIVAFFIIDVGIYMFNILLLE